MNTLNVAAAAVVAGWYILNGSGAQVQVERPDNRRPSVQVIGDDHVEVGSSLRSAAAFGFRDVLLEDRGCGWFRGPASVRGEAAAAARRHKNPLRVHRATRDTPSFFEEVVVVLASGPGDRLQRVRLAHGSRQLIIVGASMEDVEGVRSDRLRFATLGLQPMPCPPLRLVASIALAEIARQVGRRHRVPGRPAPRAPRYERAIPVGSTGEVLLIEPSELLCY